MPKIDGQKGWQQQKVRTSTNALKIHGVQRSGLVVEEKERESELDD